MFNQSSARQSVALLIAAGLAIGVTASQAMADDGHAGHDHSHALYMSSHHGGQLAQTNAYCFEVVYRPNETRIYLFDHNYKHLSMRGVKGQAALQMRGSDKVYTFPAHYVAPSRPDDHDYLAVHADVSNVRDGAMQVTFDFELLPGSQQRGARFTQTFALSQPTVTFAHFTHADRPAISRQTVCPVMGTKLGSHGTPIKATVGNQPVYLCCKSCIGKLQKDPKTYLAKIANSRGN